MEEMLTGFEARELWLDPDDQWDQKRRQTFLLNENVKRPLSVDDWVWFPVYRAELEPDERLTDQRGIAPNLQEVKDALAETWGTNSKPYAIIAITELVSPDNWFGTTPSTLDPSWQLLGYDIMSSGISFLINAGYKPDEKSRLAPLLIPQLNKYHLFPTLEAAEANFDLIRQREPSHGEFSINGLYLVESSVEN
jgi:hypothetical protein